MGQFPLMLGPRAQRAQMWADNFIKPMQQGAAQGLEALGLSMRQRAQNTFTAGQQQLAQKHDDARYSAESAAQFDRDYANRRATANLAAQEQQGAEQRQVREINARGLQDMQGRLAQGRRDTMQRGFELSDQKREDRIATGIEKKYGPTAMQRGGTIGRTSATVGAPQQAPAAADPRSGKPLDRYYMLPDAVQTAINGAVAAAPEAERDSVREMAVPLYYTLLDGTVDKTPLQIAQVTKSLLNEAGRADAGQAQAVVEKVLRASNVNPGLAALIAPGLASQMARAKGRAEIDLTTPGASEPSVQGPVPGTVVKDAVQAYKTRAAGGDKASAAAAAALEPLLQGLLEGDTVELSTKQRLLIQKLSEPGP